VIVILYQFKLVDLDQLMLQPLAETLQNQHVQQDVHLLVNQLQFNQFITQLQFNQLHNQLHNQFINQLQFNQLHNHQQVLAQERFAMMELHVLLMHVIQTLDNALTLLTTTNAAITTNAASIDALQLDAHTPQLFVTMEMLAPPTNAIQELENASIFHVLPEILIFARLQLATTLEESFTHKRIVMMELLVLLILAMLIVDV
jgi:hypothetical protein